MHCLCVFICIVYGVPRHVGPDQNDPRVQPTRFVNWGEFAPTSKLIECFLSCRKVSVTGLITVSFQSFMFVFAA